MELLKNGYDKDIRNIPSAIAGDPQSRHGVILAKSTPAKKYKITTGESTAQALRKCPGLELYPPDHELYRIYSDAMYEILYKYTPLIQRYSVDECFCDMTAIRRARENPVGLAVEIKNRIRDELGFTVNIGIGRNKVCAKMAGELKKPDMVHTLWPEELEYKLWPLPAGELFMVGASSAKKLESMGIRTIGQLARADRKLIKTSLKSHGLLIHDYANGIDTSPVTTNDSTEQKGIGNGLTYAKDLKTKDEIQRELLALCEKVSARLRKLDKYATVVSVYFRDTKFNGYRHQKKLENAANATNEIFDAAKNLAFEMWKGEPIRAMSISLNDLTRDQGLQLSMFDNKAIEREKNEALDKAVDKIRASFGNSSIMRGSLTESNKKK